MPRGILRSSRFTWGSSAVGLRAPSISSPPRSCPRYGETDAGPAWIPSARGSPEYAEIEQAHVTELTGLRREGPAAGGTRSGDGPARRHAKLVRPVRLR